MNGASRLRRRRAVHRDTTAGSIPLPQALRHQIELPSVRADDDLDHDPRSSASAAVRRNQPPVSERLAVLALGVRGDAPPRRASLLEVVVRGVHRHGNPSSVVGPRGAAGRPREQATGRPFRALIH